MAWGGWLAQNTAWWQAHERHPEQVQRTSSNPNPHPNPNPNPNPDPNQVLWISFEEIKQDAEAAVRHLP